MEAILKALKGKKTYLLVAAYVLFVGFTGFGDSSLDMDSIEKMMMAGMVATLRDALKSLSDD